MLRDTDHVKSAAIVGAGIIGASIAYHLAKRGAKVRVCEAAQPAAEASGKSFGWLNATFSKRPRSYYELNRLGMAGWQRLRSELPGIDVQGRGSVTLCGPGPEAEELRAAVHNHQEWGYAVRLIDATELQRLLPSVTPGRVAAACYCEDERFVDASHATNVLLERAQELGAEVRCGSPVTSVEEFAGDTVVLACGVYLPQFVRVPLKDAPGVLVHTVPLPRLIDHVVIAPGVHFLQHSDGRIVAGGQMVAGAGTAAAPVIEAGEVMDRAAQFLPQLKRAAVEKVSLGHRVMPEDEYPIVGFSKPNLYIAAMHSGVTLAPIIGELAAREILDGVEADLLKPYRPSRFQ